jgi:hypothetical protein
MQEGKLYVSIMVFFSFFLGQFCGIESLQKKTGKTS